MTGGNFARIVQDMWLLLTSNRHRDKVSDAETIKFMRELMGFFKAYGGTIATDAPQNPMQPAGGIQYGNVSDIKGSIEKMYLKAGNSESSTLTNKTEC